MGFWSGRDDVSNNQSPTCWVCSQWLLTTENTKTYRRHLLCTSSVLCRCCWLLSLCHCDIFMRSSGGDAVGKKYIWMLGNLVTFCSVAQEAQLAGEHFCHEKIIRAQYPGNIMNDSIQHESHILKTGPNTSFTNQTPNTFNFDRFINQHNTKMFLSNKQSKVVRDQWLARKMLSVSFCLGILMYREPEQENTVSHGQLFSPKCSRRSEAWLA